MIRGEPHEGYTPISPRVSVTNTQGSGFVKVVQLCAFVTGPQRGGGAQSHGGRVEARVVAWRDAHRRACRPLQAMSDAGLKPTIVYHNLSPAELYEKVGWAGTLGAGASWGAQVRGTRRRPTLYPALCVPQALQYEPSSHIVTGGALATISGAKTGRRCARR